LASKPITQAYQVVDAEEALKIPAMRVAMDKEVASFHAIKCIDEADISDVANGLSLVTTRLVLTIKTKEDGMKRYKARLAARGFEDNRKPNVTRGSLTAANSSHRLFYRYWWNGSGRRPLPTLKKLLYKERISNAMSTSLHLLDMHRQPLAGD
jgi:hypothetical protein